MLNSLVNSNLTCPLPILRIIFPYCLPPPHEHCLLWLSKNYFLLVLPNSYSPRMVCRLSLFVVLWEFLNGTIFLFLYKSSHQVPVRFGDIPDPSSQVRELRASSWVKAVMQYPEWCPPASQSPGSSVQSSFPPELWPHGYGCRAKIRRVQNTGFLSFP